MRSLLQHYAVCNMLMSHKSCAVAPVLSVAHHCVRPDKPCCCCCLLFMCSQVTRERIRQIEAKAIRQLRARQSQPGSVISDYQQGDLEGAKQLASRTSSGTRKQA